MGGRKPKILGVRTEDSIVKLHNPVEGDINPTDKLMMRFPKEKASFYKNVLWHEECPQAMHLSDVVTPDGKKIIQKTWDGQRSHHLCSKWSWTRCEPPSQPATIDWRKSLMRHFA